MNPSPIPPMPTTKQPPELSIEKQIEEVDTKLKAASKKWIDGGSNPRATIYTNTINGLLDRRARLMEKRDGRKLLHP